MCNNGSREIFLVLLGQLRIRTADLSFLTLLTSAKLLFEFDLALCMMLLCYSVTSFRLPARPI